VGKVEVLARIIKSENLGMRCGAACCDYSKGQPSKLVPHHPIAEGRYIWGTMLPPHKCNSLSKHSIIVTCANRGAGYKWLVHMYPQIRPLRRDHEKNELRALCRYPVRSGASYMNRL
jgi:hypothetical protein